MSAYICSDRQFQTIAEYAAEYMGAYAATVADVLKRENVRSVNTRYNEKTRSSKVAFKAGNSLLGSGFNNADIVALCNCVNYQSCENNDYQQTIAASLLNMIKLHANRASQLANEKTQSTLWSI
jgi:hypothetical protein